MLFNTQCLDAAVNRLRADGFNTRDEDVARLPPFVRHHINISAGIRSSSPSAGRPAPAARQGRHPRRVMWQCRTARLLVVVVDQLDQCLPAGQRPRKDSESRLARRGRDGFADPPSRGRPGAPSADAKADSTRSHGGARGRRPGGGRRSGCVSRRWKARAGHSRVAVRISPARARERLCAGQAMWVTTGGASVRGTAV
nr:transposase [Streptomyces sp. A1277]